VRTPKAKGEGQKLTTAARLAARRGEFVQLRRRLLAKVWIWFVALALGGALVVTPGRSHRYPVVAAGEIANTDVVVDRDVVVPDSESTEEKRRRASLEVLPVYVLDRGVERAVRDRLEQAFAEGRRSGSRDASDLVQAIGTAGELVVQPREAEVLRRAGFSTELLAVLSETVTRLYRQGVVSDRSELLHSSERGITLRVLDEGVERVELDIYSFIDAGSPLVEAIEQRLATEPLVARSWRSPLAEFLARAMSPNVTLDRGETLARRLKASASVEEVSIRLSRGKTLVRRGDEVTAQTARLLAALAERNLRSQPLVPFLGVLLLSTLLAATWYLILGRHSPSQEETRGRFGAVVLLVLMALVIERGVAFIATGVAASMLREPFGQVSIYLPALPHATGPVIAGVMFGLPVGLLFATGQAVLIALMLSGDASIVILALISGVAAAFASQRLKERYVLARVGALIGGVNAVTVIGLALWRGGVDDWRVIAVQMTAAVFGGLVALALASFLLPVLEALTGTVTDIRLLELSNPNTPLLRRLATEAPGTFQHSLAMANLAEAAAEAIGANGLLARVCCYYHDIGKLAKPEYFVENQRGDNPHDHLTPWMSSLVVANHVKAGLELARQYKLPEAIRDAIATHHGSKLIRFFYSRAKEQEDPDRGEVQENEFRYPGPRPRSKEMGILLLADAVEAASRTLHDPTPGRIQGMIDQVMKNVLEDEQLDDCELTLKDIEKVGAEFFWVLTNAFHHRIEYPGFNFNGRQSG
jgi:putative nucleotidyltransferase with HDIG domain